MLSFAPRSDIARSDASSNISNPSLEHFVASGRLQDDAGKSHVEHLDREKQVFDSLRNSLKKAKEMGGFDLNSQQEEQEEARASICYIDSAVSHPLRTIIGPVPFFLLSNTYEEDNVSTTSKSRKRLLHLGSTSIEKTLFFSGPTSPLCKSTTAANYEYCLDTALTNPLPIDVARNIISLLRFSTPKDQIIDNIPLVFYCNTRNNTPTYLGAIRRRSGNVQSFHFDINLTSNHTIKPHSLSEILNKFPKPNPNSYHCVSFSLLSSLQNKHSSNSIDLDIYYNNLLSEPLSPPPNDSLAILTISSVPGSNDDTETDSATKAMREELERLESWEACRVSGEWTDKCGNKSTSQQSSTMVDDFIERETAGISADSMDIESTARTLTDNLWGTLPMRKNLEFVERVWNLLQSSTSYNDLLDSLTAIIDALETLKLKPLVSRSNPTTFGRVIRDLIQLSLLKTSTDIDSLRTSISETFDYWLESPMEVLVELGTWKIGRDYRFLLTGDGVSGSLLDPLLDPSLPLTTQLFNLRKLHRIVEVYALLKTYIVGLPSDTLRTIITGLIHHFGSINEEEEEEDVKADSDADETMGGDVDVNNDISPKANELQESIKIVLALPRYSGNTTKLVNGIVKSFEPSKWTVILSDIQEENLSEFSNCLPSMYMYHIEKDDSIFPPADDKDHYERLVQAAMKDERGWRVIEVSGETFPL